jgi:NADPH:quinone reductase-like Zn-dependent oxidoreductase
MQAIYFEQKGTPDVLKFGSMPDPKPARWQVLVDVYSASINPVDYKILEGEGINLLGGRKFPRIPGSDFAGIVTAVGPGVDNFKPGDRVYGLSSSFLGGPGSHAEQVVAYTRVVRKIPDGLTFESLGAIPVGALTALNGLHLCDLDKGENNAQGKRILLAGASGGVGHFALQLAKYFGAHVTAVCSKKNIAFVKKLGADVTLDYRATPLESYTEKFDVFYDAYGSTPLATAARLLTANGKYVTTTPRGAMIARAILPFIFSGPRVLMANLSTRKSGFELIEKLLSEKKLQVVVAARFPLKDGAKAYQSLKDGGHAGKVVLTVRSDNPANATKGSGKK